MDKIKYYNKGIEDFITYYIYEIEDTLVEEARSAFIEMNLIDYHQKLPECLREDYWEKWRIKNTHGIRTVMETYEIQIEEFKTRFNSEGDLEKMARLKHDWLFFKKEAMKEFINSVKEVETACYKIDDYSLDKETFLRKQKANYYLARNTMMNLKNFIAVQVSNTRNCWKKSLQEISRTSLFGNEDVCTQTFLNLFEKDLIKYKANKAMFLDWHSKQFDWQPKQLHLQKFSETWLTSFSRYDVMDFHPNCPFCDKFPYDTPNGLSLTMF